MNDEPSPATWAETNRAALDAHAEQIARYGTAAEELQQFLDDPERSRSLEDMHHPYPSQGALELACTAVVRRARDHGVGLRSFGLVSTSEPWDKSVGILLVYESSNELAVRMNDDTVSRLQGWFDEELRRSQHGFPLHSMPELVRFDFGAWDVIERDYKGSVYLRLR